MTKVADFADTIKGDANGLINMCSWRECVMGLAAKAGVIRGLTFDEVAGSIGYRSEWDWGAIERSLDITLREAYALFAGPGYTSGGFITGPAMGARIREFIRRKQEEMAA